MEAQFIVKKFDLNEFEDGVTITDLFDIDELANYVNPESKESSIEGLDYDWEIINSNVVGNKLVVTFLITLIEEDSH